MQHKQDYYKIYQVTNCMIENYGYKNYVINNLLDEICNELWLFNKDNKYYQAIRVTCDTAEESSHDESINTYLNFYKKQFKINEIKFLDIHICKNKYNENIELYDYANIDENFSDGIDLKEIFPKIYECIHHVENPDKEVDDIFAKMKKRYKNENRINKPIKTRYICTLVLIGICVINYLLSVYLNYKYNSDSAIYVVLGADYKTFTLGLKQFYRLITYSFVHGGLIHLVCNMLSLYYIGSYVEIRYGHFKFLLILFYSIIIGGLTQGILSDNSICVGMSGGLYGLMVVFIADMLETRIINLRSLLPTILINLALNFLSTTAWMAHIGGAIGGFTIYYMLKDNRNYIRVALCIILLLSLSYKYVTISSIKSLYGGTDLKVLQIYNDFGLKNYCNKLFEELLNVYSKYGG